jgi:hypothetical protein
MGKLDFNRVLRIALVSLSAALVAGLAIALWQRAKTEHLTLAAGASSGEERRALLSSTSNADSVMNQERSVAVSARSTV